jgi:hypothetical protein
MKVRVTVCHHWQLRLHSLALEWCGVPCKKSMVWDTFASYFIVSIFLLITWLPQVLALSTSFFTWAVTLAASFLVGAATRAASLFAAAGANKDK